MTQFGTRVPGTLLLTEYLSQCYTKPPGTDITLKTVVQIAGVARYLTDSSQKEKTLDTFFYDLICARDEIRCRFQLHPSLNNLVQSYQLKKNSIIIVNKSRRFEEPIHKVKGADRAHFQYIQVTGFEIIGLADADVFDVFKREDHPEWKESLQCFLMPCSGVRTYFLDVWNDAIPKWPLQFFYASELLTTPFDGDLLQAFNTYHGKTLNELRTKKQGVTHKEIPLFVRVLGIVKLHHYGKMNDKLSFPYRSNMVVTDGNFVCAVSVWDEANMEYYNRIEIGSVIVIYDYYHTTFTYTKFLESQLRNSNHLLVILPMEIKVNARRGSNSIHILSPDHDYNFPIEREDFDFFNGNQISQLPDGSIVDVLGVVTYKSRCERALRQDRFGKIHFGYWVVYWLEVLDLLSGFVVQLQLYINCQESAHKSLNVGSPVIFRGMKVINTDMVKSGVATSYRYVTSTNETQIVTLSANAAARYSNNSQIVEMVKVLETQKKSVVAKLKEIGRVGGAACFPPTDPCSAADCRLPSYPMKLTESSMWKKELQEVMYWESRRLLVKAKVVEVYFVDLSMPDRQNASNGEPTTKRQRTTGVFEKKTLVYQDSFWLANCGKVQFLGQRGLHPLTLPHRCKMTRNAPQRPSWFPSTVPGNGNDEELPLRLTSEDDLNCDGYYEVTLIDDSKKVGLSCFLMPFPSEQPYPALNELLTGCYHWQPYVTVDGKLSHYGWDEVEKCVQTAKQLSPQFRTCLVDVFNHGDDTVEIRLRRILKEGF